MRNNIIVSGALVILAIFSQLFEGECVPVRKKLPSKEMEDFMKQFGYIKSGPEVADALYSVSGFQNAIRQMQAFGGLPQTGELDPATLNLTRAPRCGVPDILHHNEDDAKTRKKRYVIGAKGWKKKVLTYYLANWPPAMEAELVREKLGKAFAMWSSVTPLRFEAREGMDADLIVAFGRGPHGDPYPFDGRGNVLAHAYFPYEHGAYGGDVHFDDDEAWVDGATDDTRDGVVDFYTVAAHELGHSLGLAHSTVPGSIMFPYYKGYDPNMRLDYDDIVAMYSLYVLDNNFEDDSHSSETNGSSPPTRPDGDDTTGDEDHHRESDVGSDDRDDDRWRFGGAGDRKDEEDRDDDPHKDGDEGSWDGERSEPPVERDDSKDGDEEDRYYTDDPSEGEEKLGGGPSTEGLPAWTDVPSIPEAKPKGTPSTKFGDICEGSIDAAGLFRDELFVFKGTLMWRFKDWNQMFPGYPVDFHQFFNRIPKTIQSIDAVYQRPNDYHIIFFTGNLLWEFDGNRFTEDSPRGLSSLGLPGDLDRLDAALVWAKNGRTYLFRGDRYWRFDEELGRMEAGYPQRISRWRGLPPALDAALTWKDGNTYFFKDQKFWRFNNQNVSIDGNFPLQTADYWFGCHQ